MTKIEVSANADRNKFPINHPFAINVSVDTDYEGLLQVSLSGPNCEVDTDGHIINGSSTVFFTVIPEKVGAMPMSIKIYMAKQMILLKSLSLEITVI